MGNISHLGEQISLFNLKVLGITDVEKYSHLIGLYDGCPKGVPKRSAETDKPVIVERAFTHRQDGDELRVNVSINPAIINKVDRVKNLDYCPNTEGSTKTIAIETQSMTYPGEFENRLEEALIHIGSQGGAFLGDEGRLGIFFTLSQVKKVMAKLGSTANLDQIKEGIEILRKCTVDITIKYPNGSELSFKGTRISGLVIRNREEWIAHDDDGDGYHRDSRCFCFLHPLAASEVGFGSHTIHDLEMYSKVKGEIPKAFFRRLCRKYTYANPNAEYSVMASEFLETTDKGFHPSRKTWQELKNCLAKLEKLNIISRFETIPQHKDPQYPTKVTDYLLKVWSSEEFMKYMIKANKLTPQKRDIALTGT